MDHTGTFCRNSVCKTSPVLHTRPTCLPFGLLHGHDDPGDSPRVALPWLLPHKTLMVMSSPTIRPSLKGPDSGSPTVQRQTHLNSSWAGIAVGCLHWAWCSTRSDPRYAPRWILGISTLKGEGSSALCLQRGLHTGWISLSHFPYCWDGDPTTTFFLPPDPASLDHALILPLSLLFAGGGPALFLIKLVAFLPFCIRWASCCLAVRRGHEAAWTSTWQGSGMAVPGRHVPACIHNSRRQFGWIHACCWRCVVIRLSSPLHCTSHPRMLPVPVVF